MIFELPDRVYELVTEPIPGRLYWERLSLRVLAGPPPTLAELEMIRREWARHLQKRGIRYKLPANPLDHYYQDLGGEAGEGS